MFIEAFDDLKSLDPNRSKQVEKGSSHIKRDLEKIRKIDLEEKLTAKELLDKLRALTTNDHNELSYFESEGKKIGVKIMFEELES